MTNFDVKCIKKALFVGMKIILLRFLLYENCRPSNNHTDRLKLKYSRYILFTLDKIFLQITLCNNSPIHHASFVTFRVQIVQIFESQCSGSLKIQGKFGLQPLSKENVTEEPFHGSLKTHCTVARRIIDGDFQKWFVKLEQDTH